MCLATGQKPTDDNKPTGSTACNGFRLITRTRTDPPGYYNIPAEYIGQKIYLRTSMDAGQYCDYGDDPPFPADSNFNAPSLWLTIDPLKLPDGTNNNNTFFLKYNPQPK